MASTAETVPLPSRRFQELLHGAGRKPVSIYIRDECICSIERGLAQHFSPVWRQRLTEIGVSIVRVSFSKAQRGSPIEKPFAKSPDVFSKDKSEKENAPVADPRTQLANPLEKTCVKFVVQWMQRGGADPIGTNALSYLQGNRVALEKLDQLVTSLEIRHLVSRTTRDLHPPRIPQSAPTAPKKAPSGTTRGKTPCYKCHAEGHHAKDCTYCNYCRSRGHLISACPSLAAVEKRREEQKRVKEEREKQYQLYLERERRREERRKKKDLAAGRAGVDGDGKIMYRFEGSKP